ncbi:MAG: hypothetical protein RBU29_10200, partial [bacterium]|nr:hypothetical protein [bacterium]
MMNLYRNELTQKPQAWKLATGQNPDHLPFLSPNFCAKLDTIKIPQRHSQIKRCLGFLSGFFQSSHHLPIKIPPNHPVRRDFVNLCRFSFTLV